MNIINYLVAIYFGLIMGNFATSFYFRIPRGISLLGFSYFNSIPPNCSSCKHPLKVKEYVPIIGYLLSKGRCNYCEAKIDLNYLIIEIFSLFLSLFCYSQFFFSDWYLIFILLGISSLIASMLLLTNKKVHKSFVFFMVFLAIIYSTLIHANIYGWVFKLAISAIAFVIITHYSYKHNIGNIHFELLKILFVAFVWFDLGLMLFYTLFILVSYILSFRYNLSVARYVCCYSYLIIFLIIMINHLVQI